MRSWIEAWASGAPTCGADGSPRSGYRGWWGCASGTVATAWMLEQLG